MQVKKDPPEYMWEALNLLNVKRIDHGVQCLKDEKLVEKLAEKSNSFNSLSSFKYKITSI